MKDWEVSRAQLHMHGNVKYLRPTPRTLEQPVLQRFDIEPEVNVPVILWAVAGFAVLITLKYLLA